MNLIAYWAPSSEKAKFMASLSGGSLGTAVSWPMCGIIIEVLGWPAVFYITGGMSLAFTALWFVSVFDSPKKHPTISSKEREYIESNITGISQSAKVLINTKKSVIILCKQKLCFIFSLYRHT